MKQLALQIERLVKIQPFRVKLRWQLLIVLATGTILIIQGLRGWFGVAEGIIYIVASILACLLYDIDKHGISQEIGHKALAIAKQLRQNNQAVEFRAPVTNSMHLVTRDGVDMFISTALLLEGDLVKFKQGDVLVCDAATADGVQLRQGQTLSKEHVDGKLKLLQTPILSKIDMMLSQKKQPMMYQRQMEVLQKSLTKFVVCGLVLSLIFACIHTGFSQQLWFQFVFVQQAYIILAVTPLTWPIMLLMLRSFGNARVLGLFDQLQESTSPFDDEVGVDEFDEEASAPVKDIYVSAKDLLQRFWVILRKRDASVQSNLLFNLASSTVICSVDKEISLTRPYPQLHQVAFFEKDQVVQMDVAENESLENGFCFEDKDWQKQIKSLKPFGLNLILNTDCECPTIKPRSELHCKYRFISRWQRVPLAQQRCLCALASEIGFADQVTSQYEKLPLIQLVDKNRLVTVQQVEGGSVVLLGNGDLSLVTELSSDFWDGETLREFDPDMKYKVLDIQQKAISKDQACIGYCYAPVDTALQQSGIVAIEDNADLKSLIFLAAAVFKPAIKSDVKEYIEDLRLAGIRFVYFSRQPERESKTFAERLGLEIDWNSCIILSTEQSSSEPGYSEPHDIKAKLPRGIENIKTHIDKIDDIPLQVSLFADSGPLSTAEMVSIFQQNGDVVFATGNSMNFDNALIFAQSDVCLCVDPVPMRNLTTKKLSIHGLGAALISLCAPLHMPYETSPYVLSQTVREARLFVTNLIQTFTFVLGCQLALFTMLISGQCLLLPPILAGYQILLMVVIIFPLLGSSLVWSPPEPLHDPMKAMPLKNKEHLKDISRFMMYFVLRFTPIVALSLACYITVLNQAGLAWNFGNSQWVDLSSFDGKVLVQARNSAMFCFVILAIVVSATFIHRTDSIRQVPPYKSWGWLIAALVVLIVQVAWSILSFHLTQVAVDYVPTIIITASGIVPTLLINEFVKSHDAKVYNRFQKKRKLEFNTKLGCYSPK